MTQSTNEGPGEKRTHRTHTRRARNRRYLKSKLSSHFSKTQMTSARRRERENLLYPASRSDAYTILEIQMIEGRSVAARKKLVKLLFERVQAEVGIAPQDLEICIQESAACNWGFRGQHGDEIALNYSINV